MTQSRFVTISRCSVAIVALPPPKVMFPCSRKTEARERNGGEAIAGIYQKAESREVGLSEPGFLASGSVWLHSDKPVYQELGFSRRISKGTPTTTNNAPKRNKL